MDRVKIGPTVFEIELVERLVGPNNEKLDGIIKYGDSKILIEDSFSNQHTRQVLWHEILHGILTQAGISLDNEEVVCDALSYGILNVLQDNSWLGHNV